MASALVYTAVCLIAASTVLAGDWKRGKYGSRPDFMGDVETMTFNETHYNHVAATQLPMDSLPSALFYTFYWLRDVGMS